MGCSNSTQSQDSQNQNKPRSTSTPASVKTLESNKPEPPATTIKGTDIPLDAEQPTPDSQNFHDLYEVGDVVSVIIVQYNLLLNIIYIIFRLARVHLAW